MCLAYLEGNGRGDTSEDEIIFILTCEDLYWKQRGQQKWVLKGDASMKFFHAVDNGRRRRCMISLLHEGGTTYSKAAALRAHVDGFYRGLLVVAGNEVVSLGPNMWTGHRRVSVLDNSTLIRSFSLEEITANLKSMRVNTVPGPDEFPIIFYKKF